MPETVEIPPSEDQLPTTPSSETPAPTEDDLISETVTEINALYAAAPLQLALSIGKVVVERFYGGDLAAVRDKNPTKETSFRRLAEHPALEVSKSALQRSVALYELCTRLGVPGRGQLTMTHLRAVLSLPAKDQKRLVERAQAKGWTSTRMEKEAKKARKKLGQGQGGRKSEAGFVKGIRKLGKLAEDQQLFEDLDDDRLEELEQDEAYELYRKVTAMKLKCEELQGRLKKVVPGFEG